ncbi:MAG: hypothetical protein JKX68_04750 [Flavobacteriales bacterium]|nr:hypothetical protein [Flavobacteriales bacterium]
MKKTYFVLSVFLLGLYSCANIFNGLVLPNQCKKCELVNTLTDEVLFTNEGCGSDNTGLEDEAKIEAYDQSRYGNLCDLEIKCTTWKQESENEE